MVAETWRMRLALELRYDGPIPAAPALPADAAALLRGRMRLHRRLALDFARQAAAAAEPARALVGYGAARRAHSRLAGRLGGVLRSARRPNPP